MSTLGVYELTHPETLSDVQLKEILENRCIDFSNYKNLSRNELVELYKRVALPLPQRQSEDTQISDTKEQNEAAEVINSHKNSDSSNGTDGVNASSNETTGTSRVRTKSSASEVKQTSKKICLRNSDNATRCNGVDERTNSEKHDEAPAKKRQKITWP